MKHIIKLFTLLAALLLTTGFVSCSSDDEPKEQSLAVTPANLIILGQTPLPEHPELPDIPGDTLQ